MALSDPASAPIERISPQHLECDSPLFTEDTERGASNWAGAYIWYFPISDMRLASVLVRMACLDASLYVCVSVSVHFVERSASQLHFLHDS